MAFKPKQIPPYEASHLIEIQGTISDEVLESTLALLPPFAPGDIIHDNACGNGQVTETILKRAGDHPDITIHATDINATNIEAFAAVIKEKRWPVTAAVMPMQKLEFPDNKFTHSFTSMAFHCCGDNVKASQEIYRTLKPGGVAVASIWSHMPHVRPFQEAHWRTRGKDGPMPDLLPVEEFGQAELVASLKAGGFEEEKIECHEMVAYRTISDMERWTSLGWSYLGALSDGWSQADEERWDEAVGEIVKCMEPGNEGIERDGEGNVVLRFVACVAVARK